MLLQNLRVTVEDITADAVVLKTDQGQTVEIPLHLLPGVAKGQELFLAADAKPLISFEKQAKDILNEMVGEK